MCGIFGITGHNEASNIVYLGLHGLQHRGQEGAGIISGTKPYEHRGMGLVGEVFDSRTLSKLKGNAAIGHIRYATTGESVEKNLQPFLFNSFLGWISIAHNGNLINAAQLSSKLEENGAIFQSTSDTEVIIHLMIRSKENDVIKALIRALREVKGAYSILILHKNYLIAARDPYGFRPLIMGRLNGGIVFASESSAFSLINAEFVREVERGEIVVVSNETLKVESVFPFTKEERKKCVFEYIYFLKPDSVENSESVYSIRKALGERLAEEIPAKGCDIVIPVPDSGVPAAIGYAQKSNLPFDMGIIRSHYVGRTFIEPKQSIRNFGVKLKLSPVSDCIFGKKVVVIDDSIVRGTTSKKIVRFLKEAGAKEVHMRICSPPTKYPCFYGIDTPRRKELLAASKSIDEIKNFIGADSLGYLSLKGLIEVTSQKLGTGFCDACFSGKYPV